MKGRIQGLLLSYQFSVGRNCFRNLGNLLYGQVTPHLMEDQILLES